jgi:hypothetical protein
MKMTLGSTLSGYQMLGMTTLLDILPVLKHRGF